MEINATGCQPSRPGSENEIVVGLVSCNCQSTIMKGVVLVKHLIKTISMLGTNFLFVHPAKAQWVQSNRPYRGAVFSLAISPNVNIFSTRKSINLLLAIVFLSFLAVSSAQEKEQIKQLPPTQKSKVFPGVTEEQQEAVRSLALRAGGKISVSWNKESGTPTFFTGDIPSEKVVSKSPGALQLAACRFLGENKTIFRLNTPGEELLLLQQQEDDLGMSHLKFNQVYKGIPVWASQLIVHFNKDGAIQSINGRYHPSFEISTAPSISRESAISLAQSQVENQAENAGAELYIYPKDGMFRLAWRVKLPSTAFPNMDILVDAMNGKILRKDDGIRYQQQEQTRGEKKSAPTGSLPAKAERVKWTYDPASTTVLQIPNDQSGSVSPRSPVQNSSRVDQNWQTIMSDGFEQAFPGTSWKRSSTGSATAYWDTTTFKVHSGMKSLYCARSGSSGRDPYSLSTYPANVYTLLRYGPFSLSDASDAILQFSHWTITEPGYDYLAVFVGKDTVNFGGVAYSGDCTKSSGADTNGWQTDYLNLTATALGDLRGSSQVWIAFLFKSDGSNNYRGTFLDDVELRKEVLPSGVAALGSGIGLDGTTRSLNTGRIGTEYYLIDASRPMYVPPIGQERGVIATWDAQSDTVGNAYGSLTRAKDPNNDNNFNDNTKLRAAVDAHYFAGVVYAYYKNIHGRNSWNNNGGTLKNVVHYLNKYNNAFWNGYWMTFGDGDGVTFSNLAGALDVIGHELTHGVVEATAGLLYENQSGALNESYADVFGTFSEFYARGQAGNWLCGEDIYTPAISGDALRSMQDPHSSASWQPSHMSEYVELLNNGSNDLGGVHINSGIPNRGCYIIASTIGVQKTERIYYRALTMYLTNAAQFFDARNATLQAAADLYGRSSSEYTAVESAFTALGVTSDAARELVYDDGYPAGGSAWSALGAMYAVRMTSPATPAKILKLEYYFTGTAGGTRSFIVHILKDSSGAPGSDLISPFRVTPAVDGWFVVDMSNYVSSYHTITNGDFFVAMEYDGVNKPYIGYTDTANGRGWSRSSKTASWTSRTRTFFIRAVVSAVAEAPSANFTGSPVSGAKPLTVNFSNQSSGLILNYLWNFGDGYTSTQKNPVHTFTVDGAYSVRLTVIGPGGTHEDLKTDYVRVGVPVLALGQSSLNIGSVRVGQYRDTTVTIANTGSDTLKITSISSSNAAFRVRPTNKNVPPGQSFADTIRFEPSSAGSVNAVILLYSNGPSSPDSIRVSGFGLSYGLRLSTAKVDLGLVLVGKYKDTTFTIVNTGNDTLRITNISTTVQGITARPTTLSVLPNGSAADTIRFTPASVGPVSGALIVTSNAPTSPDSIKITASGVTATTDVTKEVEIPRVYSLSQNYPNPFNPSTTIRYELPKAADVSLKIFNTLGQLVATLVDERREAGYYQVQWNADVPTGVYFYRLVANAIPSGQAGEFIETKKLMLLR